MHDCPVFLFFNDLVSQKCQIFTEKTEISKLFSFSFFSYNQKLAAEYIIHYENFQIYLIIVN